jgi:thiol-disulfide isomerase/thioredoxin
MTPTLIFWIKAGIAALVLWVIWSIIRILYRQEIPWRLSATTWKKLLPEFMYLGMGIFFFFWVQKNFEQQINRVIKEKGKPLTGLYFTNTRTGGMDSLAAYKGKVVIINLWATWCAPCRRELPALEKLDSVYHADFAVLALTDESQSVVQNFAESSRYNITMGTFTGHPLLDSLQTRPVSILIDKDNKVQDVVVGAKGYRFFKNWIEEYLDPEKQ